MTENIPPDAQPLGGPTESVTEWTDARGQLAAADYYWLATVHPDGRPQIRPLLGVWVGDSLYFSSGTATQKARNLESGPRCSLAAGTDEFHYVIEGEAERRSDEPTLRDVADEYATKYGWDVEIRDEAFYADGAPTAGDPPYEVYEMSPERVFGFGLDSAVSSTRWQFA